MISKCLFGEFNYRIRLSSDDPKFALISWGPLERRDCYHLKLCERLLLLLFKSKQFLTIFQIFDKIF